jgi:hypothetical protein
MHTLRLLTLAVPFAVLAAVAAPTAAQAACSDPSNLCVDGAKGAKWEPDASLSAKQLKAKRKGAAGTLSVKIEEGRGSVFIDGRFAGVAPVGSVELGPGKHDLQVRDGAKILAEGVITIPKGGTVKATVRYP